jgi:hypothetical protein
MFSAFYFFGNKALSTVKYVLHQMRCILKLECLEKREHFCIQSNIPVLTCMQPTIRFIRDYVNKPLVSKMAKLDALRETLDTV